MLTSQYILIPKAALRRDAVTPSFSVRGQPEGQALRLSTVAVFDSLCPCGYEQRKCPCLYERWKGFFLLGGSRWASNEKRTNLGRRKRKWNWRKWMMDWLRKLQTKNDLHSGAIAANGSTVRGEVQKLIRTTSSSSCSSSPSKPKALLEIDFVPNGLLELFISCQMRY